MRKTKIDILIISKDYPPRIGGVATHVDHLARGLASLRRLNKPKIKPYFVHVLTVNDKLPEGMLYKREGRKKHDNLVIHMCKPDREGSFREFGNVPVGHAIDCWKKQWWEHNFHPDIVHAHDYSSALVGLLLKRAFNTKLIISIHRAPKRPVPDSEQWNVKECFLTLLHHSAIQNPQKTGALEPIVDCFVSPSQYCLQGLLDSGFDENRIKWIPHGIPIHGLRGIQNDHVAEEGLSANSKDMLVLCPVRIDEHKGLREFVDAASELNKKFPNLFFLVAGGSTNTNNEHNLLSELKERAEKKGVSNIQFGHCKESRDFKPKEMPTLYRKASICVLPSHTENYPIALLEAQAFRCPIVATNVGGVSEFIKHGKTGLLFESGKTNELVERVSVLLKNDRLRDKIVERAFARLTRHNDSERMAKAYAKLYQNLSGISLKK